MTGEGYVYQGAEILGLSDVLSNYNTSIARLVVRYAAGATRVLDFGAGTGSLSEKVAHLGVTPLCLEPDERQRAELHKRGLTSVASLEDIESESIGFIYSSNVLEHIEDDVATLIDLRRKLQQSGKLFLYVPAFQSLYSSMDTSVGHWRRYDGPMLRAKLNDAGFHVDDIYYADALGYFVTHLFKLIANNTSSINATSLRTYDRFIFPIGNALENFFRLPFGKNVIAIASKD